MARFGTSGIDLELGLQRRLSPTTVGYVGALVGYPAGAGPVQLPWVSLPVLLAACAAGASAALLPTRCLVYVTAPAHPHSCRQQAYKGW